jgi:hypothetical protein
MENNTDSLPVSSTLRKRAERRGFRFEKNTHLNGEGSYEVQWILDRRKDRFLPLWFSSKDLRDIERYLRRWDQIGDWLTGRLDEGDQS